MGNIGLGIKKLRLVCDEGFFTFYENRNQSDCSTVRKKVEVAYSTKRTENSKVKRLKILLLCGCFPGLKNPLFELGEI
ncbi:hypothetical protein B0A71_13760 [Flavobacterium tructae]|uniref:Uncharacterized protein n=1 Tax=Flavobacterium tructae TaxID=1114873 RepID=A0A1S1J5F2_9FLAO|nr:hypothetical protein BHE19_09640 [Flavobacterium tructae]OXB19002.1 hypothetical protein B0A71_13760 [Flavobacterium tructae]